MYKIPYFTENDPAEVQRFMKANPFVTLIGSHNGRSVATQVPVLIDEREDGLYLRAHIMRKTDHHLALEANNDTLILFTGPHCYVSSSWYNQANVGSTWNYITVHVRGTASFLDDAGTLSIIQDLTHKYESSQPAPDLVENMSQDYVQAMVKAIAGFELKITSIEPIFKLSQNREDAAYANIVKELQNAGDCNSKAVAEEMITRRPQLFNTGN